MDGIEWRIADHEGSATSGFWAGNKATWPLAQNIDWSILLAASVISMVPLVALYLVFQRHITSSDLGAGLKG